MKLLLLSRNGWGSFMLEPLEDDGHRVGIYHQGPLTYQKGFFDAWDSLEEALMDMEPDVVLVSDTGLRRELAVLSHKKVQVIGHALAEKAVGDPDTMMRILSANSVRTVPFDTWGSPTEGLSAVEDVEDWGKHLVHTVIAPGRVWCQEASSSAEVEERLKFLEDSYGRVSVTVQDLSGGDAYLVGAWFDGSDFGCPFVQTGDESQVTLRAIDTDCKLFGYTLKKMAVTLKAMGFLGFVGMRVIVGYSKPDVRTYELLLTPPRLTAEAFFEGLKSPAAFIRGLASGEHGGYTLSSGYVSACRGMMDCCPVAEMPWLPEKLEEKILPAVLFPSLNVPVTPPDDGSWVWGQVEMDKESGTLRTTGPLVGVGVGIGETEGASEMKTSDAVNGVRPRVSTSRRGYGRLIGESSNFDRLEEMKLIGKRV